jgi:outer membrane lipoprotein-sorting protein
MIRKTSFFTLVFCISLGTLQTTQAQAPDATKLFYTIRDKVTSVKDYVADVKLKIEVSFMRIPPLSGKLYYKSPDKIKLERNGGISILPRKTMQISLRNLIPSGNVTVIDAGTEMIGNIKTRILKILPDNEESDIVLAKMWIDESKQLALRMETTTKENGTVKMDLEYGKYVAMSLPDKVSIVMDVKDYKLPKSIAMDYDETSDAELMERAKKAKDKKGKIQITYLSYKVNTGLTDASFAERKH